MDLLRAALFLLAATSATMALAGVGGAFSDRLDVLAHFTPFYFAGGLAALIVALMIGPGPGSKATIMFAALGLLVSASAMAPDIIAAMISPRATVAVGGQRLKIVQLNLWTRNSDPAGTADWIARQDADLVVIEEARGGGETIPARLAKLYPFGTRCIPNPECLTLILSKTPPVASGAFPSPDDDNLHAGAWARFGEGAFGYAVVAVHLTWPFPPGEQQAQMQNLATQTAQFDRRSLIVAGDFNSTPWSFTLRRLAARLGLVRRTHAVFSWPARTYGRRLRFMSPFPLLPIDHVLAGSAWRTVSVARGPRLGSDHFPIVVVLTRP